MKYVLSFIEEGAIENMPADGMREDLTRWSAFDDDAAEKGALIPGEPLASSSAAKAIVCTVRVSAS
jgi:hypothetical protein